MSLKELLYTQWRLTTSDLPQVRKFLVCHGELQHIFPAAELDIPLEEHVSR